MKLCQCLQSQSARSARLHPQNKMDLHNSSITMVVTSDLAIIFCGKLYNLVQIDSFVKQDDLI